MPNTREIKVVIIDDDEDDYFIIADYLKGIEGSRFIVEWCNNYETALMKIKAKEFDIYFIDYRLGSRTGLELLQETLSDGFYAPMILLTGKGNKDIDVMAMESGATDYLIKSELNTEKLERCIRYSLERTDALKELKSRENKYRNLFEGSKDAVFIADEQLVLTEVNDAASVLFAAPIGSLVHRNFYDFIKDPSHREELRELFGRKYNIRDMEIEVESLDKE